MLGVDIKRVLQGFCCAKVVLMCMLCFVMTNANATTNKFMTLMPGAVETIKIGTIKRVAVGLDAVAAASVLDTGELLIIARSPGTTDIRVWTEGDRPHNIRLTVKLFNGQSAIDALRASLKGLPGVSVRSDAGLFIIEGGVTAATKERTDSVLEALGQTGLIGENVINLVHVSTNTAEPLIRMDVRFVEVNKGAMQKLGIRWQSEIPGPSVGAHITTTANPAFGIVSENQTTQDMVENIRVNDHHFYGYVGITTFSTSILDMLAEDNQAKTLAAPVLITQSGTQANFLSGGELPIVITSSQGPTVEFKQYGIQLEMEPRIYNQNQITSTIKTEVSSIDKSVTVLGVPGLLTRRTNSVVTVKDGDTIVISGIVKADDAKVITKLPYLGDIPILGELFKSRNFSSGQSELVVFVTIRRTSVEADINTRVLDSATQKIDEIKSALNINSALLE